MLNKRELYTQKSNNGELIMWEQHCVLNAASVTHDMYRGGNTKFWITPKLDLGGGSLVHNDMDRTDKRGLEVRNDLRSNIKGGGGAGSSQWQQTYCNLIKCKVREGDSKS